MKQEPPWASVGTKVGKSFTAALENLSWKVDKAPVFYELNGQRFVWEERSALIRTDTKEPIDVVPSTWKHNSHTEIFQGFADQLKKISGTKIEAVGSLDSGRLTWLLASAGKGFEI